MSARFRGKQECPCQGTPSDVCKNPIAWLHAGPASLVTCHRKDLIARITITIKLTVHLSNDMPTCLVSTYRAYIHVVLDVLRA